MARIAGINIPNHQHAEIALTAIYGIGRARAQAICVASGVEGSRKIKDLTDSELDRLRDNVMRLSVEGDLRLVAGVCAPHPLGGTPVKIGIRFEG